MKLMKVSIVMRNNQIGQTRLVAWIALIVAVVTPFCVPALARAADKASACKNVLHRAVVIDDSVNVASPIMDLARRAQLAPVSQALQVALTPNPCLELLDNDPLFWTLPGAVQPDVILRARLSELAVAEQSLGDKAGSAVGRYLGAYLGNHAADVPVLSQVGIAVDVLCPKSRKKATTISVQHAETQPLAPEQNALRLQAAAQLAAQEVVNLIARNQQVCMTAPAPAFPLS